MDNKTNGPAAAGQRPTFGARVRKSQSRGVAGMALVVASSCLLLASVATTTAVASPRIPARTTLGKWIKLGLSQTAPAAAWRGPDNRDWVVWASARNGTYSLAIISPAGHLVVRPKTIITGWSGVTADPTLLPEGTKPLLVFSGQKGSGRLGQGCVVGALSASPQWAVQSWSLSQNCVFSNVGYGDAAKSRSGQLSAAWAGGSGVEYRLGTSASIPAGSPDRQIALPSANANSVAEANDLFGNGDTYVAFDRFFDRKASLDGVYVKNLTRNGPLLRAPQSGTESVSFPAQPQRVAMAGASVHGGIYIAYCSNAGTCDRLLLWRVGARKAIRVPDSRRGLGVAMSRGPGGRLWLSWYSEQSNRVFVVQTNKADNRFGRVRSYPAPCFADGNTHIALTGGSFGRVDVALECLSAGPVKPTVFLTQSLS